MKIYNNFFQELEKKLNEAQIKFSTEWEKAMKHNGYRRAYTISPTFDNDVLTKQYDVEIALKDAINNQDLIIVAGDGSNDFTMLNPLKYINKDFYNKCYQESTKKDFYQSSMEDKLKVLEKIFKNKLDSPYLKSLAEEFNKNGFIEKIKELPLYSVIIGQKNNWLNFLVETFEQTGKVITVESGNLEDGILRAIKDYSSKNEIFKQNLSKNFIKYLK